MDILCKIMLMFGVVFFIVGLFQFVLFNKNYNDVMTKKIGGTKKIRTLFIIGYFLLIIVILLNIFSIKIDGYDIVSASLVFCSGIFILLSVNIIISLVKEVKKVMIDVSSLLVNVIELREKSFRGHSCHVAELSMLIYSHLPKKIRKQINPINLKYAALLHDLGKVGIDEKILNKTSSLDYDEWRMIRIHPLYGKDILAPYENFDDICEAIYYHHERADGKGYFQIDGNKVPLMARIIAVADTYSAITAERPYKSSRTHEDAMEIIKSCSDNQLDKVIVDIFLSIPKEEFLKCVPKKIVEN